MRFRDNREDSHRIDVKVPIWTYKLPVAPHILFFSAYNAIYYVPLLLAFLLGYSEGGVAAVLDFTPATIVKITGVYLIGTAAFVCGAKSRSLLCRVARRRRPDLETQRFRISVTLADKIAIAIVCLIFLASKIAIIPLGVYHAYAFDTDQIKGGAWSFSAACSETLLFISILVLFSGYKRRLITFSVLTLISCINLLHGTRMFFVIAMIAAALYAYTRGYISIRRALIVGPIALLAMLGITYLVFLRRESASPVGNVTVAKLLTPLIYESVFSQLSLISLVNHPRLWSDTASVFNFGVDTFLNAMPRLLAPDKDSLTYISKFGYLSPLGGFNGYAEGLIYFGGFCPAFYFLLGIAADWFYTKAQKSGWWIIIYAYLTSDFLFRMMRDGYLIPIKMLINCMQVVCILWVWRLFFRASHPVLTTEQSTA
jgi:hypothetical protein